MDDNKSRYQWLKENGICVQCGQRDAFPGYVRCPGCIEKANIASARCRDDKDKRLKYNKHERERGKQLYEERKRKHMCTTCGRTLPEMELIFGTINVDVLKKDIFHSAKRLIG